MATPPESSSTAWCLTVASEPTHDRVARKAIAPGVTARLVYARSREAATRGQPGQDYAVLEARGSGRSLTFCVADGVGSSYFGGFAASYLSLRLLPWLQGLPAIPPECSATAAALTRELTAWAAVAHRDLPSVPDAVEGGAIVREVLQGLRDEYGSETVFLAGRLDLPGAPSGATDAPPAALLLCWMGNVTATLLSARDGRPLVAASDDDRARWSTGRGVRGEVRAVSYRIEGYDRLIVHTDGASPLSALIPALPDDTLLRRAESLRQLPTSDDVTILDLWWGSYPPGLPGPSPAPAQDKPRG